MSKLRILDDLPQVASAAADEFVARAKRAIQHHGRFTVALSGGSTPKTMHTILAERSAKNPKLVEQFVRVSQQAFAACVADAAPCLKALLDQVSGLDKENQQRQWERIKFLMTDDFTTTKALGWIDGERMKKDYELVQTYLGMEKPFEVGTAFNTRMLDPTIKMDASKVKK